MKQEEVLRAWGNPDLYSPGLSVILADRQIRRGMENGTLSVDETAQNRAALVTDQATGKWFLMTGGWENDSFPTAMLGAACGDVAGSVYEHHNIKYKPNQDRLIQPLASFTDDTIMTCAVAEGIRQGLSQLPDNWMDAPDAENVLCNSIQQAMLTYGRKYLHAGYGRNFYYWLLSNDPQPYHSWGNGSAMRVSYAGWAARSLAEAEKLGELSALVTHNHPEGMKGAAVVAGCIFLLRNGKTKADLFEYAGRFYDLNFTLDGIRDTYRFDVSCMGSVPQAIRAFLEAGCFSEVIANAISIGGDSDTIAAIAGSIAEVVYPIPQGLRARVIDKMDPFLLNTIAEAVDFMFRRLP